MSEAEDRLERQLLDAGVYHVREHRFGAEAVGGTGKGLRKRLEVAGLKDWRSDFAIPDAMLLIEIEGGAWAGGRHTTGAGFEADLRKYHAAMRLGWTVYRCSPAMVKSGAAAELITHLLEQQSGD